MVAENDPLPALQAVAHWLARMHHGRLNAYVAYVLLTLIAFLAIGAALSSP